MTDSCSRAWSCWKRMRAALEAADRYWESIYGKPAEDRQEGWATWGLVREALAEAAEVERSLGRVPPR